jgi:hypothetical protein
MARKPPGRKFDVWHYEKDGNKMDVPVRIDGTTFGVVIDAMGIDLWSENLKQLQADVFKILDEKLALEWTPWLHITVHGNTERLRAKQWTEEEEEAFDWEEATAEQRREYSANENELEISLTVRVQRYLLTTTPTGQKLSKQTARYHNPSEGWPDIGLDDYSRSDDEDRHMQALVPDTPENREALNTLARDCQRLVDRLKELFAPDRVQSTLKGATHYLALSGNVGHLES